MKRTQPATALDQREAAAQARLSAAEAAVKEREQDLTLAKTVHAEAIAAVLQIRLERQSILQAAEAERAEKERFNATVEACKSNPLRLAEMQTFLQRRKDERVRHVASGNAVGADLVGKQIDRAEKILALASQA